ncbi:11969_t:CDS:2 [Ambispora gerdemannii]|uniref:11969_t:CDS:1 n=1 Tax=Ambispora gerdemannii TaxID=144530 RepID=A0A9N8WJ78_9GLOM|nr:11969_t:CDS:2 [Ambispora gerdemannii]
MSFSESLPPQTVEKEEHEEKIILNVNNVKYETYRSTLTAYPETLLGTMFQKRNSALLQPKNNNEYSINRDGNVFYYILEYYREGKLTWAGPQSKPVVRRRDLDKELDYFLLPPVIPPYAIQSDYQSCLKGMEKICQRVFSKNSRINQSSTNNISIKVTISETSRFLMVRYINQSGSFHVSTTPKAMKMFGLYGEDIYDQIQEQWPGLVCKTRAIDRGILIFLSRNLTETSTGGMRYSAYRKKSTSSLKEDRRPRGRTK